MCVCLCVGDAEYNIRNLAPRVSMVDSNKIEGREGCENRSQPIPLFVLFKYDLIPQSPLLSVPSGRRPLRKRSTSSRPLPPELDDRRWPVGCESGHVHWGVRPGQTGMGSPGRPYHT